MLHANNTLTVKVNGDPVQAKFVGWSPKYPGYARVRVGGKTILRKINAEIDCASVPDEPSVTTRAKADFSIAERFGFIAAMVNMIVAGTSNALIITGSGGLGKTYTVMQALSDADLGDYDVVMIKGYATARSVYDTLYSSNGKVVVFDDCDSVLEDRAAINVLKGALDTTARRVVSWNTSVESDSIPSHFVFTGRIIFISNKSVDKIPQPILSRSLFVDVTMTTAEKLERIRQVMADIRPDLSASVKAEVLSLIEAIAPRIRDLNIRTFVKACDIRSAALPGVSWNRLAEYVLTTAPGV